MRRLLASIILIYGFLVSNNMDISVIKIYKQNKAFFSQLDILNKLKGARFLFSLKNDSVILSGFIAPIMPIKKSSDSTASSNKKTKKKKEGRFSDSSKLNFVLVLLVIILLLVVHFYRKIRKK